MLGPAKPRRLDQPIAISLENLIPANHFYRHLEEKLHLGFVREWARERYTEACKKAMRKRQVWVEPLFAEAKAWHGLHRFPLRGLLNVNIEGLAVATGQNLKRLLARRGWGRRPFPTGATSVALPAFPLVPALMP